MQSKYYIDTAIWVDLLEERKGFHDEPMGDYAIKLFTHIRSTHAKLIITDVLVKELLKLYSNSELNSMLMPFQDLLEKCHANEHQRKEAMNLSSTRDVPFSDALHAIIARDSGCTLVSRDRHFRKLSDICKCYKPEELM